MLNLDPAKLLVIGMLALIVLGPERLPKVARQLGGAWRELTRIRDQVTEEVKTAFPIEDLPKIPKIPNASSAITSAVSNFTRSASSAMTAPLAGSTPDRSRTVAQGSIASSDDDRDASQERSSIRRAPSVVVHPALGEFAFLPDDPSMN